MSPRELDADPNWEKAMKLFHGQCVLCRSEYGVTIHEMTPKSLAPKTWKELGNRVALCQPCHDWVHRLSKRDRDAYLLPAREKALKYLSQ